MIQSLSAADALEHITRTIVDAFQPRRVILFGSRARGDARPNSDIDVVVELDESAERAEDRRWEVARFFTSLPWEVQVTVRIPGEIERRYNDPGYMDWDIAREGTTLYRDSSLPLESWETGAPARVREGPSEPESLQEWLEHAEDDLLAIENHLAAERIPWGVVCFHAQQAAEKHLKVLLVRRFIRPIRTHDLVVVLKQCREHGYTLPDLEADCREFEGLAVDPRYRGKRPTEAVARAAVAAMRRIVAACLPLLRS